MGRGAIVSGGAGGLYQLEIRRFTDRAESNRTELETGKTEADIEIVAAIDSRALAEQFIKDAADAQDAAIAVYNADPTQANLDVVKEATEVGILARNELEQSQLRLDNAHGRRASILQEIRQIDAATNDPTVSAWCADLTEDLAADTLVGTIEIPDEKGNVATIIRPAYDDGGGSLAAYDANRDGALQPVISTTPQGFLRNACYLPGSQKWLPQYRLGVITALDDQTGLADITLDAAISTGYLPSFAQGIDVNQTATIEDVPFQYLNCNHDAFAVSDHVVVEFDRDWSSRKVIGFANNPKPCELPWIERFTGTLESGPLTAIWAQGIHQIEYFRRAAPGSGVRSGGYWGNSIFDASARATSGWFISDNEHYWEWVIFGNATFTLSAATGLTLTAERDPLTSTVELICYPKTVPDPYADLRDPPYTSPGTLGRWWTCEVTALSALDLLTDFYIDGPRQLFTCPPALYAETQNNTLWFNNETDQFVEIVVGGRATSDRDLIDPPWRTYVDPNFSSVFPGVPPDPPFGEPWFGLAGSADDASREYGGPIHFRLRADSSTVGEQSVTIRELSFLKIDTS